VSTHFHLSRRAAVYTVAALAVSAACAVPALAVHSGRGSLLLQARFHRERAHRGNVAVRRTVPRAAARQFRVFARSAVKQSSSDTALENSIVPDMMAMPVMEGANPADAEVVTVSPSFSAVVLAGPNGVCIGGNLPAAGSGKLASKVVGVSDCNTLARAEEGDVRNESRNGDGSVTLFGLVPNRDTRVSLTTSAGAMTVPVVANVYYAANVKGVRGMALQSASRVAAASERH
jgi:hypothetical protein